MKMVHIGRRLEAFCVAFQHDAAGHRECCPSGGTSSIISTTLAKSTAMLCSRSSRFCVQVVVRKDAV